MIRLQLLMYELLIKTAYAYAFSGPNGNDSKQPMYPGFERDVFRTVAEHFQRLKEPLLTLSLYEIFVSILGKRQTLNTFRLFHFHLIVAEQLYGQLVLAKQRVCK